jgi:hypothetical protein
MSRESVLLAALSSEPVSTSSLYERIGYATLTRLGLVAYGAFRDALAELSAAGIASSGTAQDGSTVWWLSDRSDEPLSGEPSASGA